MARGTCCNGKQFIDGKMVQTCCQGFREKSLMIWSSHLAEYGCQSCSWSAEQGKLKFPCPRTSLRICSRDTGSAVPSRVSLLILHTQVESGERPCLNNNRVYGHTSLTIHMVSSAQVMDAACSSGRWSYGGCRCPRRTRDSTIIAEELHYCTLKMATASTDRRHDISSPILKGRR